MQIQKYRYSPKNKSVSVLNVCRAEGHRVRSYHMHDHQEIVLVYSRCTYRVANNGNFLEVRGPVILVNRAGTFHEADTVLQGEYRSHVGYIHPQNLQELPESMQYRRLFDNDLLILPLTDDQLERLIALFEMTRGGPIDQQRLLLLCVLSEMEQMLRQGVEPVVTNAHRTYIFDVIEMIQSSGQQFTATELADRFHVSKSKLWADFRQITGVSLGLFSRQVRLQQAQSLLETTNLEITQIARKCGFSDESYFIGSFRKAFGVTPGSYRRENS